MLCRMPVVSLPHNLTEQLKHSESGTIYNTDGPGVAVYWASDATVRADIYVGLQLDGFTLYQNLSSVDPNIKIQFALEPVVSCQSDVLTFRPPFDTTITIQVIA